MYHETQKREIAQAGGIRRMEFRYSGNIDESGRFLLKRCVGKSFLDKGARINTEQDAGSGTERQFPRTCPEKTA
jgi:hypothetical protein